MEYAEARSWLEGLGEFHMEFGLDRVRAVLAALANPERAAPVIHVAGTNGKGMTCAYAASMLRHQGVKVGLYTSPHLSRPNERISILGEPIGDVGFADALTAVRDAMTRSSTKLTYFEAITCAAFTAFREAHVGAAVIEVGLGGRLDATNVVDPAVSVITHVSLDHMAILGDTIEKIAVEKAGIVKRGRPVVVPSGESHVHEAVAERKAGGKIWVCGRDGEVGVDGRGYLRLPGGMEPPAFWGETDRVRQDCSAMAAVAVRLFDPAIEAGTLQAALRNTHWPGRGEVIAWTDPVAFERIVLLDGAHNPAAAARLAERTHPDVRGCVILFAAMADKDYEGVLAALAPLQPRAVICTTAGTARSATPRVLAEAARRVFGDAAEIEAIEPIEDAFYRLVDFGMTSPAPGPPIVVAGSLYLVGKVREIVTGGPPTALG